MVVSSTEAHCAIEPNTLTMTDDVTSSVIEMSSNGVDFSNSGVSVSLLRLLMLPKSLRIVLKPPLKPPLLVVLLLVVVFAVLLVVPPLKAPSLIESLLAFVNLKISDSIGSYVTTSTGVPNYLITYVLTKSVQPTTSSITIRKSIFTDTIAGGNGGFVYVKNIFYLK